MKKITVEEEESVELETVNKRTGKKNKKVVMKEVEKDLVYASDLTGLVTLTCKFINC